MSLELAKQMRLAGPASARNPPIYFSLALGLQVCVNTPAFLIKFLGVEHRATCLPNKLFIS